MCAGDARALLGDGLLGDLHQNLLPGLQQVADGGQVGGLHGGASTAAAVSEAPAAFAEPPVLRGAVAAVAAATPSIAPSIAPSWAAIGIASAVRAGCGGACLLSRAVRLFRLARLRLIELCVGGVAAAGCLLVELVRLR